MPVQAAARVGDPFGHSSAMSGVMIGLAVGALIGTAILTGGISLIAVGAAVAITGGAGLAGEAIGQTIPGPETGVITIGSHNVFINDRPAAMTVLATGICSQDSGPPVKVATGAATVFINDQPAARVTEKMDCSAVIRTGSNNVFIGGPSVEVIKPTPEVPALLEDTMLAMVIGGTLIGTLGVGLTFGAGAAVGSLVGGVGGSYLGGKGATMAAAALGFGATGQAVAGVVGGFVGGALGGGLGFRGGLKTPGPNVRGPSSAELQRIQSQPAGFRDPPESYLSKDYIDQHLQKFDEGGSYLVRTKTLDDYGRGTLGRSDGQFVMPKSEMDNLMTRTGGDVGKIEQELGIPSGSWNRPGETLSRIDIDDPSSLGLRMPSGNEAGANPLWMPAGQLPGGGSEAVINPIPAGSYSETIIGKLP